MEQGRIGMPGNIDINQRRPLVSLHIATVLKVYSANYTNIYLL